MAEHYDERGTDMFAWYSIGLLVGMAAFLALRLIFERKSDGGAGPTILGD